MNGEFEDDSDLFEDIELPFDVDDGEDQSSNVVYYDGYLGFVGLDRLSPLSYETKRYNKLKDAERTVFRGIVQNLIVLGRQKVNS